MELEPDEKNPLRLIKFRLPVKIERLCLFIGIETQPSRLVKRGAVATPGKDPIPLASLPYWCEYRVGLPMYEYTLSLAD
jgi:hypothetical protein